MQFHSPFSTVQEYKEIADTGTRFFSGKTCSDSSELILKFIPSLINIPEVFSRYVYVFDY